MQNMKAHNIEELSDNLKEVADSIKEGYHAGIMSPRCIWKIEGEEEHDEEEKVFRIKFKPEVLSNAEVFIRAKSKKEAEHYFENLELLRAKALELGREVLELYEVEQCKY